MVNIRFYDPRSKEERITMLIHWLAERCWQATRIERFFKDFSRFWESLDVLSQQVEGRKEDRWDNV